MKWIVAGSIVLIISYGLYEYLRFKQFVAIGVELSNKAVRFEQPVTNPEATVLVTGDSSAVGTGAADSTGSTAGRIGQDYPTYSIVNTGVNGQRLAGLIDVLNKLKPDEQFDYMVIQIGANDVTHFTKFSDIELRLHEALTLAEQHAKHIVILHGGKLGTGKLMPWFLRGYFNARTYDLRNLYLKEVKQWSNVHYVDIVQATSVDDPFAKEPAKYYAADYFHPSSEGYGVWYQQLKPFLAKQ